jgi:hypothetical protein
MAPERRAAGIRWTRADVFSLGVVLREMCAGRRLFARESEAATLSTLLSDEAASTPSGRNEDPAEAARLDRPRTERRTRSPTSCTTSA